MEFYYRLMFPGYVHNMLVYGHSVDTSGSLDYESILNVYPSYLWDYLDILILSELKTQKQFTSPKILTKYNRQYIV